MEPYETIVIGGREYYLKLSNKNAVKLEKSLKMDIHSEVNTLAVCYYYLAAAQNDSISCMDDIYLLFDRFISDGGSYQQLREHLIEALVISGVLTKEAPKAAKTANNSDTVIADIIKELYDKALEVGVLPAEFWEMSLQETRDTVFSRIRKSNNDIYAQAALNRMAILSSFSKENKFPKPPNQNEHQGEGNLHRWKESQKYMQALAELGRKKQSKQDNA